MSKQSALQKELTAWCQWGLMDTTTRPVDHKGYVQSCNPSEAEFIDYIESAGWKYKYKENAWLCPACAKANDDEAQ